MGRCGCADTCNCAVVGELPITVTGTGSATNPYTVGAKFSTDADNIATRGSDGGFYVPDSGSGASGGVTVSGLPATGLVGAWRCGSSYGPENTMIAARMSHNGGSDIIHFDVHGMMETAGGLVLVADSTWDRTTTNYGMNNTSRQGQVTTQWGTHVDYYNGTWYDNNLDGTGVHDPEVFAQERVPLLTDMLAMFARRVVLMPHIHRESGTQLRTDLGTILVSYITRYAAQQAVIVTADALDDLAAAVAANIATCLYIPSTAAVTANPPATVAAAGVEWIAIWGGATDAQITSYQTAGLNVVIAPYSRQYQRTRATSLAVRGVLSIDPVYTAEHFKSLVNSNTGSLGDGGNAYVQGAFPYGTLGERAALGDNSAATGRGFPTTGGNSIGGYWVMPQTIGTGANEYSVLTGSYKLQPARGHDPNNWFWQNFLQWDNAPSPTGWGGGVFFSCVDDRGVTDGTTTSWDAGLNGYRAHWQFNGALIVVKITGGVATTIHNGTWRSGAATVGSPFAVAVRVTPTQIIFHTTLSQTVAATISDSSFRGLYSHVWTSGPAHAFTLRFSPRDFVSPSPIT